MSHWTGTLELVRQSLVAATPWADLCTAAGSTAADRTIIGMGGFLADGTIRPSPGSGAASLGLPLAVLLLEPLTLEPAGFKKWSRSSAAIIDLALAGPPDAEGYLAAAQFADDLVEHYVQTHNAGTLLSVPEIAGPPLLLTTAPGVLRGAWTVRLRTAWTHGAR